MTRQVYSITKTSFNHGLWSPNADGNFDDEKYPHSCTQLDNFIPTLQGGLKKRQGFNFEHNTDDTVYKIVTSNIEGTNYLFEFGLNNTSLLQKVFVINTSKIIRAFEISAENKISEISSITLTWEIDSEIGIISQNNNYVFYQEKQPDYTAPAYIIELHFDNNGMLLTEKRFKLGENNHKKNDSNIAWYNEANGNCRFWTISDSSATYPKKSLFEFYYDRNNPTAGIQYKYDVLASASADKDFKHIYLDTQSRYSISGDNCYGLFVIAHDGTDNTQNMNAHSFKMTRETTNNDSRLDWVDKWTMLPPMKAAQNYAGFRWSVTFKDNFAAKYKIVQLGATEPSDNIYYISINPDLKFDTTETTRLTEANIGESSQANYSYFQNSLSIKYKKDQNSLQLLDKSYKTLSTFNFTSADITPQKFTLKSIFTQINTKFSYRLFYLARETITQWKLYLYSISGDTLTLYDSLSLSSINNSHGLFMLDTFKGGNLTEVNIWNADTNTFVQQVYCSGKINDFVINQNAIYLLYNDNLPQILYYDLDVKVFNIDNISPSRNGPFELSGNDDRTMTITIKDNNINTTITSAGFNIGIAKNIGYLIKVWLDPYQEKQTPDFWLAQKNYSVGDYVYSSRSIYRCVKAGTAGKSYIPPTHTEGIRSDGDNKWEWHDCLYAYYEIISQVSDKEVNVTRIFPDENPFGLPRDSIAFTTWKYQFDAWRDEKPELGAIMHSRLSLLNKNGTNIYFSSNDDPLNFEDNTFGQVEDTDAFTLNAITDYGTNRTFLAPCELGLIIGTNLGEKIVKKASISSGFIPTNVDISEYSYTYSTDVKPVRVKDILVFIQDTGKDIRAISIADDDYYKNLSFYSGYVCKGKFTNKLAYMREQYSLILAIDDIGNMYGMLYDKMKDIYGIFRIIIGVSGDYKILDVVVDLNNIAYILALNTTTNKKAIFSFGEKHKFIFDLAYEFDIALGQTTIKAPFLYNSTGKAFLKYHNGTEVYEVAVAQDGIITLPSAGLLGQKVLVGLKIDAIVQSQNVEFQEGTQTTGAKTKKVNTILVDFIDTTEYNIYSINQYPSELNIPFTGYSYIYNDDQKTLDTNIVGEQTKDLSVIIESNKHGYCEINRINLKLTMEITT